MRFILVDWLIEVYNRFDFMLEIFYLIINLVDRFLGLKVVLRRELQFVGIGVMLIVCKYEEIWVFEVNDFVVILERVYSNEQIFKMEKVILGKLEWYLIIFIFYVFFICYIKVLIFDEEVSIWNQKSRKRKKEV